MGGKFHLKLTIGERRIAIKFREGKVKRSLKRELKVVEIAKREAVDVSDFRRIKRFLPLVVCVRSWQLCVRSRRGGREFPDASSVKIHSTVWEKVGRKVGDFGLC